MQVIVLLAPPGGGKGTQSSLLAQEGFVHLSTGDLLREAVSSGSQLGKEVAGIMERGELVSDDVMLKVLRDAFLTKKTKKGFVFDGFPRNLQQGKMLDELLERENLPSSSVIYLNLPDSLIVERIIHRFSCTECGNGYHALFKKPKKEGVCDICGAKSFSKRKDDTEDLVAQRLSVFHEQTNPLYMFYQERGVLKEVDGTLSVDEIFKEIKNAFVEEKA